MDVRRRDDGLTVIDDAYNANPESMRAALGALVRIAAGQGRSWAVLGPMRELGPDSAAMHADVGRAVAELGVEELVTVGPDAEGIASAARSSGGWRGRAQSVADAAAAATLVAGEVSANDVVLVKASNSERLWRVADRLVGSGVEVRA
jgi:UDP-N-acetylmuramoyl-tripeptide--D-alanyl-D-alanine ligase